jgi:hypothetical protein
MSIRPAIPLAAVLVLLCDPSRGLSAATGGKAPGLVKIFSGEPCLLIVHGYSTSQHWWAFLQRKIDRYSGGPEQRKIEVQLCNKGGTPIAKWMDVKTGKRSDAWRRMLTPMIQAESGRRPVVVMAQQSLQWVFPGERNAGIRSAADRERIQLGAKAIDDYGRLILEDGADLVIVAMHIFKRGMEPAIGNERYALAELMKRRPTGIEAGPDVWEPTSRQHPLAFDTDKIHPNFVGAEIMAHHWFATLLQREGLEVPVWSREEMTAAIEQQPMGTRRDNAAFSRKLQEWKITRRLPASPGRNRSTGRGQRPGNPQIPRQILQRYDKDGDGKLNATEQAVFDQARKDRRQR